MAGDEPGINLSSTQVQDAPAFTVPVEVFGIVVGLQDYDLVRILNSAKSRN